MSKVRLPAEWEAQQLVMLCFPRSAGDYGILTNEVAKQHLSLCLTIARYVPVLLLVPDPDLLARTEISLGVKLASTPVNRNVHTYHCPADDVWIRDFGPLTVLENGQPRLLDFRFDGWGQKFPATRDNRITRILHADGIFGTTPLKSIERVLEGGAIDVDGRGTMLTTRRALLDPVRNPDLRETEWLTTLKNELGLHRIHLLEHGHLENDDTDAHVDTLARFAPHDTIVYQACTDAGDAHFAEFRALADELADLRTDSGQPYRLLPLPWPPLVRSREDGRRLPATYANFLVTNGAVILPAIHEKSDPEAVATLRQAFPGRQIVLQPADLLLEQHGSIHCLTMQIPLSPGSPVVPGV